MMRMEIEFRIAGSGIFYSFKVSEDEQRLTGFNTYVRLKDEVSGEEFVYPAGSTKIYRPERNILCAKEVKLSNLRLEYFFEDDEK